MTCSMFRKRLPDFLQGNLPEDMKNIFIKHMNHCKECKEFYDKEIFLDSAFENALKVDDIKFNGLRTEILKNINKNRYTKKATNKLFFYFKRNKIIISTCVVLFAVCFFITPYVGKVFVKPFTEKGINVSQSKKTNYKATNGVAYDSKKMQNPDLEKTTNLNDSSNADVISGTDTKFVSKFDKVADEVQIGSNFGTSWSNSPSSKLSISIVGKGTNLIEEGIAKIYVKDLVNNKKWVFTVPSDKNIHQYTPKNFQWYNDNYIILIAGLGYGTVTRGGNLYYADMMSGSIYPIFENDSSTQEIISVKKLSNDLHLKFNVYEDNAMMKAHTEDGIIKDFDPSKPGVIEMHNEDGTTKVYKLRTPIVK